MSLLLLSCQKEGKTIATGDFGVTLNAELPELPVVEDYELQTRASSQYTVRIKWQKETDCL